jgi:hypothetical protein
MRAIRFLLLLVPWLGTWLVWREAQRQQVQFKRMIDDLAAIKMERMEVTDSELLMQLCKDDLAARVWAGIWREVIDSVGAPNFLEFKMGTQKDAASDSWLVVTVQRVPGLTPADKLRDAEARIAALEDQRNAMVATLDRLYAEETARCQDPDKV